MYKEEEWGIMFENIAVGIITLLIYGFILMGCIIPFVFIVRTKHNITKFGYGKYIFFIVGLEIVLIMQCLYCSCWQTRFTILTHGTSRESIWNFLLCCTN